MLLHAEQKRVNISQWVKQKEYCKFESLVPKKAEWVQVSAIIQLLAVFGSWSDYVSGTTKVTMHLSLYIMNSLIAHIEQQIDTTANSAILEKKLLHTTLEACLATLKKYHSKTN